MSRLNPVRFSISAMSAAAGDVAVMVFYNLVSLTPVVPSAQRWQREETYSHLDLRSSSPLQLHREGERHVCASSAVGARILKNAGARNLVEVTDAFACVFGTRCGQAQWGQWWPDPPNHTSS